MMDKLPRSEVINTVESPFYPGIADNRLFFHGTNSIDNLNKIMEKGIKRSVNNSTLSRRISFSGDPTYSGGDGYLIGAEPEWGEIDAQPSIFLINCGYHFSISILPPERNVFYMSAQGGLPSETYDTTRNIFNDYFAAGFDQNILFSKFGALVQKTEKVLNEKAVIKNKTVESTHRFAQNIVWNEMCSYLSTKYNELITDTNLINNVRQVRNIATPNELNTALTESSSNNYVDIKEYLNYLRLIANVAEIDGFGYEKQSYPIRSDVIETAQWLTTLKEPDVEKTKSKSIIEKIKSLRLGR